MKKIQKNDLHLEKEVISKLSQDDLAFVKGGASLGVACVKTDGCVHPISYDGNCKTMDTAATCMYSCEGGCSVKSINVACYYTEQCAPTHSCQGGNSDCICARP